MAHEYKHDGSAVFADVDNEHFDLAFELLCTLPKEPQTAIISCLVMDLGLGQQTTAMALIRDLRSRGYPISTANSRFGREAWIPKESWDKAYQAGADYWNKVYGSPKTTCI